MRLSRQQYGKAHVRVLKVTRDGSRHEIKEVDVSVMLEGNFDAAYTSGDNGQVVATDTMKNTVNVLAKEHLGRQIETFGMALSRHFLSHYPQVRQAEIRLTEHPWRRLRVDGIPQSHAFMGNSSARPFVRVIGSRESVVVEAGIEDLLILKSTKSGFEGFPRDAFTTLPETKDRIMATSMTAFWLYQTAPPDYAVTNQRILDAMLKVFALNYSPSVQATLYQMAEAALTIAPEISQVTLKLPNQHCLLVNMAPFGLENKNEIFVPTDEPHGQIEATVTREPL